jgi:hypothetical protein
VEHPSSGPISRHMNHENIRSSWQRLSSTLTTPIDGKVLLRWANWSSRPRHLGWRVFPLLVLVLAYVFASQYHYAFRAYLNWSEPPFSTSLFFPEQFFTDGINDLQIVANNSPYLKSEGWLPSIYPPFAYLQVHLYRELGISNREFSLYSQLAVFALIVRFLWKPLAPPQAIFVAVLATAMCNPLQFLIDRGNFEIFAVVWLGAGLLAYERNPTLGSMFMGLAAATKVTPLIFLVLPFCERRWRATAAFLASGFSSTILALLTFEGSAAENLRHWLTAIGGYAAVNGTAGLAKPGYMLVTADIWSGLQILAGVIGVNPPFSVTFSMWRMLSLLTIALIIRSLWRRPPLRDFPQRVSVLTCAMIALPHTMYEYKLAHFVWALVLHLERPRTSASAITNATLVTLIIIPRAYLPIYIANELHPICSSASLVSPLLMIGILLLYSLTPSHSWDTLTVPSSGRSGHRAFRSFQSRSQSDTPPTAAPTSPLANHASDAATAASAETPAVSNTLTNTSSR